MRDFAALVTEIMENGRANSQEELENEFEFLATEREWTEEEIRAALGSDWFPHPWHGGARPGAGRKPRQDGRERRHISVNLTAGEYRAVLETPIEDRRDALMSTYETKGYHIDSDKLAEVTRIFNEETDPRATEELVESEICADWNEGEEHQDWIDSASPQEIADWLASFYE